MKRFFLFAALCAFFALSGAVVATGDAAPELPSPLWFDGKTHQLAEFKGKPFTVIYLWNPDQMGLRMLPAAAKFAEENQKEVSFIGIWGGDKDLAKRFPGLAKLPFPVNFDRKHAAEALYVRSFDRLPLAVLLDRSHKVLWRGNIARLDKVLAEVKSGKFNLAENIHKEKFSADVSALLKKKDFEKAVDLVQIEREKNPDNVELLSIQVMLLAKQLKQTDRAFALISGAHAKTPKSAQIYELEYKMLLRFDRKGQPKEFFSRLAKDFADQPMELLRYAQSELGRNPDKNDLDSVRMLMETGWASKGFSDDKMRGIFALEYAQVCHNFGRLDLAVKYAAKAHGLFPKGSKEREQAKKISLFYQKLRTAGTQFSPVK